MVKVSSEGEVASIEAVNRAHPFYRSHVVWEDEDAVVEEEGRTYAFLPPCSTNEGFTLETRRSMRSCDVHGRNVFHLWLLLLLSCCWSLLLLLVAAADEL